MDFDTESEEDEEELQGRDEMDFDTDSEEEEEELPEWLQKWKIAGLDFDDVHPEFYYDAITVAALKGDVEAFRCIQDEIPDAAEYLSSSSPSVVYLAAKNGRPAFLDYVIRTGPTELMDYPNNDGKSPLWAAVYHTSFVSTVKLLIARGASFNPKYRYNFSPLLEFKNKTLVEEYLAPLYDWVVKMKERTNQSPPNDMNVTSSTNIQSSPISQKDGAPSLFYQVSKPSIASCSNDLIYY